MRKIVLGILLGVQFTCIAAEAGPRARHERRKDRREHRQERREEFKKKHQK